jgi:acyl carrier protein
LKREYGINIQDPKEGRKVLVDVNTMATYIEQNGQK